MEESRILEQIAHREKKLLKWQQRAQEALSREEAQKCIRKAKRHTAKILELNETLRDLRLF